MLLRAFLLKVVVLIFFFSFCSTLTLSSRERIYGMTALGIAGGAGYGLNQNQAKVKNPVFYGFILNMDKIILRYK